MIYICADDYGLNEAASARIEECVKSGALNKVSVFPNFQKVDITKLAENHKVRLSLHLNLVEGKCMAPAEELDLLVDERGIFKNTFIGLLKLSILHGEKFRNQVYKEIRAQVLYWKSILPKDAPFCIDGHQHTHMIPGIFKALIQILRDEKIELEYMRIPAEPIAPFVKTPSLYLTYSVVNVIKQWLLKILWRINKKIAEEYKLPTTYFFGILFSGKMDKKRVLKVLPKFCKAAKQKNCDVEVLFHPGYLEEKENTLENTVFDKFYLSKNRKVEFDTVMEIKL